MSILTLGSKKRREGKFPIKGKKRRKISNQRESKKKREGKFPIKGKKRGKEIPNQRVGESEKKRKKIPNQRVGESKRKERKLLIKDRKKSEEMCRKVFGPDNICTIQNCHQMNKKRERKPRPESGLLPWITNQNPVRR